MEEPLLPKRGARSTDALGALAGDPHDSAASAATNPRKKKGAKKTPLQPHGHERDAGNLQGNDSGAARPHQEETKKTPLQPHGHERDAGNLQGNDSGAARPHQEETKKTNDSSAGPNPHQVKCSKKTPLQPHQDERDRLLEAVKPQPDKKEDVLLKPPSQESAPANPSQESAPVNPSQESAPVNPSQESALVNRDKKIEVGMQTPTLASLTEQARDFAQSAAGTSMAAEANALCSAADQFACGKGGNKRVIETDLNKAAMDLCAVAEAAPNSEARLATRDINLTHAAQMPLLSEINPSSTPSPGRPRRPSLMERLRAAISPREPRLPITEHEKQLVAKREVLYSLALAAPVAILTAAAGLKLFDGEWGKVAGVSAGVWVLAASGMILNQYGVYDWELLAARHLGRLGILGAAVLFCLFTYRAFFPLTQWVLYVLLVITAIALGSPWILSCVRGDDVAAESNGDAAGTAGELEMRRGEPARRHTI